MSGIPGSRVGGIGPTPNCRTCPNVAANPDAVEGTCCNDRAEHIAGRQRTPEEDAAVKAAKARRSLAACADQIGRAVWAFGTATAVPSDVMARVSKALNIPVSTSAPAPDATCYCNRRPSD